MTFKIGNLMPDKEINVVVQLIMPLQIVGSAYQFVLPMAFYPDYRQLGAPEQVDRYPYAFSYIA